MEIFNLIFFLLIFFSFKKEANEEYLSVRYFNILKGICILMVFIGHLSKEYHGLYLYKLTCSFGALAVPAFFFVSGYGLMFCLIHKKNYTDHFIKQRIFPIIINYIIACILWLTIRDIDTIPWIDIILCNYFVPFSWYIFAIIFLYACFYMATLITKKNNLIIITVTFLLSCFLLLKEITHEYIHFVGDFSMYAFIIGMILPASPPIEECFMKFSSDKIGTLVITMLFLLSLVASIGYKQLHLGHIMIQILIFLSSLLFPIVSICWLRHFRITRIEKFWILLQSSSLQIYLMHGIIFYALKPYSFISSEIWVFIVFASTVISSYCLNKLVKKILVYV